MHEIITPADADLARALEDRAAALAREPSPAWARLRELRAERDKLEAETIDDLFCCKTERDFHYADEDLAAWDQKYGAELDTLMDELGRMTLTAAQITARDGRLTASRVACLMTGDEQKIMDLWREMVGDPSFVAEDLSGVWPIQLGVATEALNLRWYAKKTGRALTRQGEVVVHRKADWAAATLDAWDAGLPGPVEAKHVGGREPLEKIIARYQPQIHWQMIVTGARAAAFSIIEGSNEPVVEPVPFDERYARELWSRAEAFMECVWSLTPPIAGAAMVAPVKAERIVDMTGDNEWSDSAATWLENIAGKRAADTAEKSLKAKVPTDAARCFGHGVVIARDRANRLTLRESK